jgi:hypothetical protein
LREKGLLRELWTILPEVLDSSGNEAGINFYGDIEGEMRRVIQDNYEALKQTMQKQNPKSPLLLDTKGVAAEIEQVIQHCQRYYYCCASDDGPGISCRR